MAGQGGLARGRRWSLHAIVTTSLVMGCAAVDTEPASAAPVASVVTSANQSGVASSFNAIACVSPTDCVGVGSYSATTGGSHENTLVEHWNGSGWSIVDSPNVPGTENNSLSAVACTSNTSCVAVGSSMPFPDAEGHAPINTLVEQFDGVSWKLVPSPNDDQLTLDLLQAVACTSSTNCFAVGSVSAGNASRTLVERWDGAAWAIATSPNRGAGSSALSGVTCSAASNCIAVGSSSAGGTKTLVEQWNGTAWKIVASPNPNPAGGTLASVACTTKSSCFAVGAFTDKLSRSATLVERWNGTAWKVVSSPTPSGTKRTQLAGVSCASSTNCLAVGSPQSVNASKTVLEHWNGTKWSIVANPALPGVPFVSLEGVACKGKTCFAAGSKTRSGKTSTLVERYS